eukprot:12746091-Prorocentrum_lima.AAC.1
MQHVEVPCKEFVAGATREVGCVIGNAPLMMLSVEPIAGGGLVMGNTAEGLMVGVAGWCSLLA